MLEKVCFVSVSGGKDSALVLALAIERYRGSDVPVVGVFSDTGWEHPLTYAYLREAFPSTPSTPSATKESDVFPVFFQNGKFSS